MNNEFKEPSDILLAYFVHMDSAPVGEGAVFADDRAKERHESLLIYSLRKYQAASYHFENVRRLLAVEPPDSISTNVFDGFSHPHGRATAKFFAYTQADRFIYELAAFLEAAKSSLDFLATASLAYFRGIQGDSIRTLIRLADQPLTAREGPILDAVKRHLSWLKQLREYRHHLVHRMVISASTGQELHKRDDCVMKIEHPVVVPETTPSYLPDTRLSRLMEEHPRGLDMSWRMATAKNADGTEKVIDFSVNYQPSTGYVEISEFMASHFTLLGTFISEVVADIGNLNFKKL
ncbi:MAG: hypothetical protein WBX00_27890 [Isosphaeraceae bacterium]